MHNLQDIVSLHTRLKIVLCAEVMGQARSKASVARPKMCLMLWIACAYDRTSLTMKNAYKGSKLLGMQITQLDNVDYAQKICGVMGMNKKLSLCAYAVQMGVVDPIVCHRIRVWNLQPDLRGIHNKNQRRVNTDDGIQFYFA